MLAREDAPGEKRLVAYYTAREGVVAEESALAPCRQVLPDYMVPVAYVQLQSLPLTPNGKVDRKALPAPERDAYSHREYEAPQGDLEESLAQLWRDLLTVDRISRHDDFFALGGHSLLAVQLVSRITQGLSLPASVQQIFEHRTVQGLAQALGSQQRQEASTDWSRRSQSSAGAIPRAAAALVSLAAGRAGEPRLPHFCSRCGFAGSWIAEHFERRLIGSWRGTKAFALVSSG